MKDKILYDSDTPPQSSPELDPAPECNNQQRHALSSHNPSDRDRDPDGASGYSSPSYSNVASKAGTPYSAGRTEAAANKTKNETSALSQIHGEPETKPGRNSSGLEETQHRMKTTVGYNEDKYRDPEPDEKRQNLSLIHI